MKKVKSIKKIIIAILGVLIISPLVILPMVSVIVYESIFNTRYKTESWLEFSASEYEGLSVERSDFQYGDIALAGYKYAKQNEKAKGVVVIAHGLGGGGHNSYMPIIDYFTSSGYYVFAYDAIGNDNSDGDAVEGFPEGVICLDLALDHAAAVEEYQGLPFTLFGHSWGGYSVGNVLNFHPEVKAAVIVSGFNESEDLIAYHGERNAGSAALMLMPLVTLYERIKFGEKYTDISALGGFENTDAGIMIIHSENDATVPMEYGYGKFYEHYADSWRFEFISYEDRGHSYLFYSQASKEYRERLNADYTDYVENNGKEYSAEVKTEFMSLYLDKKKAFEPDSELMERIISLFDNYCVNTR